MLSVTPPIALTSDDVWIFITGEQAQGVEAARVAFAPDGEKFIALPVEVFNTNGAFPTFAEDGAYVMGFRWATTADVDAHADQFAG